MRSITANFSWNPDSTMFEVDSGEEKPQIVTLAVLFSIDGLRYVLMQKKDMGWPTLPGGKTLFGGQIEESERPEDAVRREAREELGSEFVEKYLQTTGLEITALCDLITSTVFDSLRLRMFAVDLGEHSYPEWVEKQKTIKLGEGIGFVGVTYKELQDESTASGYVPHDRDMAGYALMHSS